MAGCCLQIVLTAFRVAVQPLISASHPLAPLTEPTPVTGEGEGGGGGGGGS